MSQVIRTAYPEYTWPTTLTEITGKDISSDAVQIGLGTYDMPPVAWTSGVIDRPTASSATIKMLVDGTVSPGTYWVWVKVTDTPETPARIGAKVTVI